MCYAISLLPLFEWTTNTELSSCWHRLCTHISMQSKVTADCYTALIMWIKKQDCEQQWFCRKRNLFVRVMLVYKIPHFSKVNHEEQFYTHSTQYTPTQWSDCLLLWKQALPMRGQLIHVCWYIKHVCTHGKHSPSHMRHACLHPPIWNVLLT